MGLGKRTRRVVRMTMGWSLVVVGTVLVPMPIPSTPLLLGGLALLAEEYVWAQRALEKGKRTAHRIGDRFHRHPQVPEVAEKVETTSLL